MITGKRSFITIACAGGIAGLVIAATVWWWHAGDDPLDTVHQSIAAQYPAVEHVTPQQLALMPKSTVILFDTRQEDEFAVSHLAGAIRIPPDLPPEQFIAQYADSLDGKAAVFYCSVGARSSEFADRVQNDLVAAGTVKVANLQKGLFGWHNEDLPQVDASGQDTDFIHPFNGFWGRLIKRSQLIAQEP